MNVAKIKFIIILRLVSEFWKVRRDLLRDEDRSIAQREFDRIVLQAVYYIVSKKR